MCSPVTSLPQFKRGHFRIGQRGHYCLGLTRCCRTDLSAVDVPPARCAGFFESSTLCAAEPLMARCPLGCRPELGGPWVPAFAGKTRGKKAGAQKPRWCRCCRTDLSAADVPSAWCAGFFESSTLCAAEPLMARCPLGCH